MMMTEKKQRSEIVQTIRDAAQGPKSTTVDGTNVVNPSVDDMIKAEEFAKEQEIAKRPSKALRTFRVAGNSMR